MAETYEISTQKAAATEKLVVGLIATPQKTSWRQRQPVMFTSATLGKIGRPEQTCNSKTEQPLRTTFFQGEVEQSASTNGKAKKIHSFKYSRCPWQLLKIILIHF